MDQARVESTIELFKKTDFFHSVGQTNDENAAFWTSAERCLRDQKWFNFCLDTNYSIESCIVGNLYERKGVTANEFAEDWNRGRETFLPRIDEIVERELEDKVRPHVVEVSNIEDVFRTNLLDILLEVCYSDFVENKFFSTVILESYKRGLFPLGLKSKKPFEEVVIDDLRFA